MAACPSSRKELLLNLTTKRQRLDANHMGLQLGAPASDMMAAQCTPLSRNHKHKGNMGKKYQCKIERNTADIMSTNHKCKAMSKEHERKCGRKKYQTKYEMDQERKYMEINMKLKWKEI